MKIKIQSQIPSLNKTKNEHWTVTRDRRWQQKHDIQVYMLLNYTQKEIVGARTPAVKCVRIHSQRQKLLDYDNLVGGAKTLLDALRDNQLVVDDTPHWVTVEYTQAKGKPYYTEITVEDTRDE